MWYVFAQPLGFIVFLVAAFAEAARLPFDLPEAEQELVGGYHTEYSGIKLLGRVMKSRGLVHSFDLQCFPSKFLPSSCFLCSCAGAGRGFDLINS